MNLAWFLLCHICIKFVWIFLLKEVLTFQPMIKKKSHFSFLSASLIFSVLQVSYTSLTASIKLQQQFSLQLSIKQRGTSLSYTGYQAIYFSSFVHLLYVFFDLTQPSGAWQSWPQNLHPESRVCTIRVWLCTFVYEPGFWIGLWKLWVLWQKGTSIQKGLTGISHKCTCQKYKDCSHNNWISLASVVALIYLMCSLYYDKNNAHEN